MRLTPPTPLPHHHQRLELNKASPPLRNTPHASHQKVFAPPTNPGLG